MNSLSVRISSSVREGTINLDLEMATEASYLVATGVRPMALVYDGLAKPDEFLKLASQLERVCDPNSLPFVVDHRDGRVGGGYAGAEWVIDLYEWATSADIPAEHRHAVLGLLLGYDVRSISRHDEGLNGRRFELV
jgi:hypothetical protein